MLSLPRMDREMLQEHLAQAERHISEGECHIARQREIIAELDGSGQYWQIALDLLHQFEQLQALHIADRDRLRKELS